MLKSRLECTVWAYIAMKLYIPMVEFRRTRFLLHFLQVLALQVVFELGMSYVVMQFASHEMAHLFWTPQGTLDGDAGKLKVVCDLCLFLS